MIAWSKFQEEYQQLCTTCELWIIDNIPSYLLQMISHVSIKPAHRLWSDQSYEAESKVKHGNHGSICSLEELSQEFVRLIQIQSLKRAMLLLTILILSTSQCSVLKMWWTYGIIGHVQLMVSKLEKEIFLVVSLPDDTFWIWIYYDYYNYKDNGLKLWSIETSKRIQSDPDETTLELFYNAATKQSVWVALLHLWVKGLPIWRRLLLWKDHFSDRIPYEASWYYNDYALRTL